MHGKVLLTLLGAVASGLLIAGILVAQKGDKPKATIERPPHGQDALPGPALSPAEAIKKMKVPEGFSVELVLSEPDLINPVSMCFDERGRIWVTESIEYPRRSAGPGKDRIKVFESTKGDGKYDKMTVFAEGLNIPSGIAVGHGGVWVANSPDILFYKEGKDGKAAGKPEVVVTGFGRDDTHELPNSLTWGPDGYLYGLNGVFNRSRVKQDGKTFDFTCALFRIHPKTRKFELFCEGTSNPWGLAIDPQGSFFVSACVIDHLWHLTETGYYHRQGGAYPPFTWKIESIVKHKHQKAAYCGLVYFDSDAYPLEYRDRLYMGNIHGSCINSDELTRDGSTYFAKPRPDFLTANDAWFMPVAQKVGPDGCLYILDWYDRYHCYQDANRDPAGIDRERGRLYRIRYKNTKPAGLFDLAKESNKQLIDRLSSPNVFYRETAQRLLTERFAKLDNKAPLGPTAFPIPSAETKDNPGPHTLSLLVEDEKAPRKARLHALWAIIGSGRIQPKGYTGFHRALLEHKDPTFRAWGVRALGNKDGIYSHMLEEFLPLAKDKSPDVLLQVAIAARKVEGVAAVETLLTVLNHCGDDKLIPHIVWQNLHPLLETQADRFLRIAEKADLQKDKNLASLMPRVVERVLARKKADPELIAGLVKLLTAGKSDEAGRQALALLAAKIQTGEIKADDAAALGKQLKQVLERLLGGKPDHPLFFDAALLAVTLKDTSALDAVRQGFASRETAAPTRLRALEALIASRDAKVLDAAAKVLNEAKQPKGFRAQVLAALGRMDDPRVASVVLTAYPQLEPEVKAAAVDLLSQRTDWGKELLKAVAAKKVSASALSVNQVRKLLASKDRDLIEQVKKQWGTLREDRNPEREKVVKDMRDLLKRTKGDPMAGVKVFQNVCAKCHKIHGEGQDVGPDITNNGRSTFDLLLSNVFDPSLVIGAAYQATTVVTKKGRSLSGLLVEESAERVVLKLEGGKTEAIPRDQIDEMYVSKVSLMPEGVEKQLKPQEIADLFAFLCLDKPPSDPNARKIPGAP